MLSIVENRNKELLTSLQSRVAATKRACGKGFPRYSPELRGDICRFVEAESLSPGAAARLLGVSGLSISAWLRKMSGFRAIAVVEPEAVPLPSSREIGCAKVHLGNGVLIEIPAGAIGSELLATLARL